MVFLFGPPGAGKGTQADLLVGRYNFKKFSMGDLLREEVAIGSSLGKKIEPYLKKGVLAPDEIVFEIVEDFVLENLNEKILFDGFPRNLNQAIELEKLLARYNKKIDLAIELYITKEEVIKRMLGRLYCSKCGAVYNEVTNPPRVSMVCDECGNNLEKREDDNTETIKKRLEVYEEMTRPLSEYYKSLGILVTIDASGQKEDVYKRIARVLDGYIK
ncbi:MAG: adenylate kinase [candidate division WOR-3 bacterium]|nr:adenylate kinase [candidate division WOR-3 bacterium]